ncbi:MAG: transcription-repair coupling factor [Bacilli bacterium]
MDFLSEYFDYKNGITYTGLTSELNPFCVYEISKKGKKDILVVTNSLYEANLLYDSLVLLHKYTYLFPMDDFLTSVAVAISPDLKNKRLETMEALCKCQDKPNIVVTNLTGYLKFLPDINKTKSSKISLKKGMSITHNKLIELLEEFGYKKESMVTTTGEYAVRGYIIDIFILDEEHPIRIEFFGDDVESIRYFDESTQKSLQEIDPITIKPYMEIETNENSSLIDYMNDPIIIKINPDQLDLAYLKIQEDITSYNNANAINKKHMFEINDLNENNIMFLSTFNNVKANTSKEYFSKAIENFNDDLDLLKTFAINNLKDKKVIICLSRDNQIKTILEQFDGLAQIVKGDSLKSGIVNIIKQKIRKGFIFEDYIVISENDISKSRTTSINYKNNLKIGKKIKGFDQIQIGDYVVHTLHGIGIYNGIITLTKNGMKKDYIQINYLGNDKVYIPVEKINTIYKYSSRDGYKPKINKLNSTSWVKTKRELTKKVKDISAELIKLYAARANVHVRPYHNIPEEEMFKQGFSYQETSDQQKAINDINADLNSSMPMDRLLCGDVGFGKTEVAFRGMFKTVYNGEQVFYLCPTTILSKQQYENALERFKDFPVEIALLNRFTTKKETERILNGLEKGTIDIVFGTHRLLSNDVKFKRLGMLVVDEEQRFGVTHKEKIKEYKNDVNVLTLSATPIPRTLKMALSGLRDLSIIDTAPVDRYPVQTYVLQENDLLIKDAIYKELSRNGQIFILYNKVDSIESMVNRIHHLVPEARITFAHGQMKKTELENVMQEFIDYTYDILICTTIVETGIDIANANTLIVLDADCFGLSQLYQLRGRVGRSNKIAYAYLMYNKSKVLNDVAVKRLQAIKDFTELGSGYRIAMRDLAIRGAGDILGSEQAGFVDTVGIDLYMKMIEDEMKRINGEEVTDEEESTKSLVDVETHISDEYVADEEIKIEIHQKINEIDSYNKLLEVKAELEDRFGKVSEEIEIYMYEEWFEKLASDLKITNVIQTNYNVQFEISEEITSKIKGDKLFIRAYQICPRIQFKSVRNRIIISINIVNLDKHFLLYLIPLLEEILSQIKESET